jgi:uncharacterized surface protein with fasciclin (FAS1) repeats
MKTNFKIMALALVAFASFSITSCNNDDDAAPAPKTITQLAQGNADLSILVQALTKADLANTLNSAGTYTVFAPKNQAFIDAGLTSAAINALTTPTEIAGLKNVLLNHVISTKLTAAQLTTGYRKTLAVPAALPTGKMNIYVSNTSEGVILNGISEVTSANTDASNGVIHVVDAVITLPSIVTFVDADPNFNSLYAALTRGDQLDENFGGILSGTASSPFTVFAPTNTAFNNLLTELGPGTTLANIPEATLTKTLKYHVVTGDNVVSTALPTTPVTTFGGQTFTIEILAATGAQIRDERDRVSKITDVDVQANNGVVHVIDKVLLTN